jgi:ACT domain-containing protein
MLLKTSLVEVIDMKLSMPEIPIRSRAVLGSFSYKRTYYRDKKTGDYIYLCDQLFGIEP